MPKKSKIIVINLVSGEIEVYRNKQDAAVRVGIHRNSLVGVKDRKTFGNYLIVVREEI